MLATTLASAMPMLTYAEVIKRNATASTTAMAQNYLNKGTSSLADLSYSKLLSNGSKYSFITDATLLPTLYSNWRAADVDSWYFYGDDGSVKTGWVYDHGWYYLSTEEEGTAGLMRYGWYQDSDGSWYFLNTVHDGTFGRAVSGWQWIDGYSYYFDENCRLVVSGSTTDGYTVDNDGRWIVDGVVQYVEGKGLTTQIVYLDSNMASNVASDSTSSSDDDSSSSSNGSDDNSTSSGSGTASGDNTDSTKTDSTDSDSTSKDEKDSDGDGVPDWLEEYLGTSSSSSDTDGDGISDYDEIYIIGSDPTVNDSSDDADSDGISNLDEINTYKTDPTSKDTDGDTLSDYDEIFVHYTDPLKADTDGDGISDADEIGYGFDPLVADSDGNGTPDGQESITITASYDGESIAQPTAQITLQAGAAASVNIERDDPETSIWMTEDVPGMLDAMYDFTVDGEIQEATLTFSFTEDESADFYPAIYYVDTENQEMTELENQVVDWEAKTVTARTNHFSGYVTLNKVEQDEAWKNAYFNMHENVEVTFVINEESDMLTVDSEKKRVQFAKDFIDILQDGDMASVIGFGTTARVHQYMTDDLSVAKTSLDKISNDYWSPGCNNACFGLEVALHRYIDVSSPRRSQQTSSEYDATDDRFLMSASTQIDEQIYEVQTEAMVEETDTKKTMDETMYVATSSEAIAELDMAIDGVEIPDALIATSSEVVMDVTYENYDDSIDAVLENDFLLASSWRDEVPKDSIRVVVILTRKTSADFTSLTYDYLVEKAIEAGVKIYGVYLGTDTNYTLSWMAEETGGKYYKYEDAYEFIEEFRHLIREPIDTSTDSDGDGISDYYEDKIRLFNGVMLALDKNNPDTDGDGIMDGDEADFYVTQSDKMYYHLTSYPNLPDSDFDGRNDDEDSNSFNNRFSGQLKTEFATSGIEMTMDYRYFFLDNTCYYRDLSMASILLSSVAYENWCLSLEDSEKIYSTDGQLLPMVLDYLGFENPVSLSLTTIGYTDQHVSEVGLGYRTVKYHGQTKNIVAVVVRGTNATLEEWASDFDVGDISKFGTDEMEDWTHSEHHAGFDIPSNRIMRLINDYVLQYDLNNEDIVYWITGHSRGAAIANIIGMTYEKTGRECFTYAFATPNTTMVSEEEASSYRSIFNIVNADDFVPTMPVNEWGYRRYGRTARVSILEVPLHLNQYNALTSQVYSAVNMTKNNAVNEIRKLISGDPRVEAYKYTCSCHGDGSDDSITIVYKYAFVNELESKINKIINSTPEYAKDHYEILILEKPNDYTNTKPWRFSFCQTPEYYMQIVAATMTEGFFGALDFALFEDVAPRYSKSRAAFRSAGLFLSNPHYTESYYILAYNIEEDIFE